MKELLSISRLIPGTLKGKILASSEGLKADRVNPLFELLGSPKFEWGKK
jgi:hypothetical protein